MSQLPMAMKNVIQLAFGDKEQRDFHRVVHLLASDPFAPMIREWDKVIGESEQIPPSDDDLSIGYRWGEIVVSFSVVGPYALVGKWRISTEVLTQPGNDPIEQFIFGQLEHEGFSVMSADQLMMDVPLYRGDAEMFNEGEDSILFNYLFTEWAMPVWMQPSS